MADEVDLLVAAWRAARPDLDLEPLEVLSRISRLARHLDRARSRVFADHGLETWEFDMLAALRRAGSPYELSAGALLHATLVSSGAMTNRIDRMEAAGLVRRATDPADGRVVLVRLTEAGRQRADAAMAGLLDYERTLLQPLRPAERRRLAAELRRLLAGFESQLDGRQRSRRTLP